MALGVCKGVGAVVGAGTWFRLAGVTLMAYKAKSPLGADLGAVA